MPVCVSFNGSKLAIAISAELARQLNHIHDEALLRPAAIDAVWIGAHPERDKYAVQKPLADCAQDRCGHGNVKGLKVF